MPLYTQNIGILLCYKNSSTNYQLKMTFFLFWASFCNELLATSVFFFFFLLENVLALSLWNKMFKILLQRAKTISSIQFFWGPLYLWHLFLIKKTRPVLVSHQTQSEMQFPKQVQEVQAWDRETDLQTFLA